jgi:hypothetical protein
MKYTKGDLAKHKGDIFIVAKCLGHRYFVKNLTYHNSANPIEGYFSVGFFDCFSEKISK